MSHLQKNHLTSRKECLTGEYTDENEIDVLLAQGCSATELAQNVLHSMQQKQKQDIHSTLEQYAYAFGLPSIAELPLLSKPLPNGQPSPYKTGQMVMVNGHAYTDYLRALFRMMHKGTPLSRSRHIPEYRMAEDLLHSIGIKPAEHQKIPSKPSY